MNKYIIEYVIIFGLVACILGYTTHPLKVDEIVIPVHMPSQYSMLFLLRFPSRQADAWP